MRRTSRIGAGVACLLTAAVAPAPLARPAPFTAAETVAALFEGSYDNRAQFDAADAALKVPPGPTGSWLDREVVTQRIVDAPLLDGTVLYLEWRRGGGDGPITRQRLWVFRMRGPVPVMDFYTLRDPAPLAGKARVAGAFATLGPADLKGYGDVCAMTFAAVGHAWRGTIDPARCRIVAASGRGMRLTVRIDLDRSGFAYQEAGTLDDGGIACKVPPTIPYSFLRVGEP